tara:strand:+ start:8908 stop:9354 length:447 start_codon:yes stop_codon:yes gene_type:complete
MNELTGIVAAFIVGFSGLLYVAYDNLEYKGYGNTKSCTGECYEEYVRVNGTLIEQMEAKRLASQADPYSDIRGLWAGCAACHGSEGQGMAAFPKLAGQSASYIQKALEEYRAGETRGAQSVLMWGQAGNLTDDQIFQLASFVEVELSE